MSKTAVVLSGTDAHIELLKQLKNRGYRTVLVDYLENPLAKPYADIHAQVSTFDLQAALDTAIQYDADVIITACADQVNTTACYVAERLGLPCPYSYDTAVRITNKAEMKKAMVNYGVPTTRYCYLNREDQLEEIDLTYPVMVKPVDSHGATGVKRANNADELKTFVEEARNYSRSKRVVIEEFFEGVEISAYTIVKDGKVNVVMISERLSVIEGEDQVIKCYATVTPPNITDNAKRAIEKAANRIAQAFGLVNTPLHVQAIVNGDEISIIEFAARVAGGLSTSIIKNHIGADMISVAIDSYLKNEINFELRPQKDFCAVNLIYGKDGVYDHLEGIEELVQAGIIEEVHCFRKKGSKISGEKANACRVAAFITSGMSRDELHQKAVTAIESIRVIDVEGNDITRRDLLI